MATLKNQTFVFDKDDFNPKCITVMALLEDLVKHFKYLMEDAPSPLQKGVSRPCHIAIKKVAESLTEIQRVGREDIIPAADRKSLTSLKTEIEKTLEQLQSEGDEFVKSAKSFADDPLEAERRATMISASRLLVRQVTKLLILADYVDVANLLEMVKATEAVFNDVRRADTGPEFEAAIKVLGAKAGELYVQSGLRQADLLPEHEAIREELAAARQELKDSGLRLIATSKAYFVNPNMKAAADNRQEAVRNFQDTLKRMTAALKGGSGRDTDEQGIQQGQLQIGANIGSALDNFEDNLPDPIEFDSAYHQTDLQTKLESIIEGAAAIADMSFTSNDRKEKIIGCCEAVRLALSDLLGDYMNASAAGGKVDIQAAIDNMIMKNRELHGHLRRAAGDQIGDAFLNPYVPISYIYAAAMNGEVENVKEYSAVFNDHSNRLVEAAKVSAFTLSDNPVLKAKLIAAANDLSSTIHPVINAAITLSGDHTEPSYIENMDVIRAEWDTKLKTLTDAVNESVDVVDFLAHSQQEILKEIGQCVEASQEHDAKALDNAAAMISGRVQRIHDVVMADMACYEPDYYVDRCKELATELNEIQLKQFANTATRSVEQLKTTGDMDNEELISSSTIIFSGVQDVYKAVLETRSPEEYAHLLETSDVGEKEDAVSGITGITIDTIDSQEAAAAQNKRKEFLGQLADEQQRDFEDNIQDFKKVKQDADLEFEKWDDSQNDLIAIARKMTKVMMQMTEYTRGEGPLTTNKDVIRAAAKLSHYGTQLRERAQPVAAECTDRFLSEQLLDHVAKIDPLQHQLKLLAKVKQEVESVAGDLVVSELESVTSLIQNAKNLLAAVLETVRAAHTCSIRMEASPIVWNAKVPTKKPLIVDTSDKKERRKLIRRETNKYQRAERALIDFIN